MLKSEYSWPVAAIAVWKEVCMKIFVPIILLGLNVWMQKYV